VTILPKVSVAERAEFVLRALVRYLWVRCDYRLGEFRTTVALDRFLRHGLVHNHRRDRRSVVSVRYRMLVAQISL